jgi:hypothetical protein
MYINEDIWERYAESVACEDMELTEVDTDVNINEINNIL